jgi:hypothetical protein
MVKPIEKTNRQQSTALFQGETNPHRKELVAFVLKLPYNISNYVIQCICHRVG